MHNEELIYIEADEEITAIIDRLRQSEAASIRLILPKGALVLQSLVSLKLLQREALHLKKDIAVVSADPVAQHLAEEANLTVYAKPKDKKPVFAVIAPPVHRQSTKAPQPEESDEAPADEAEGIVEESEEEVPDGIQVHHYGTETEEATHEEPAAQEVVDERKVAETSEEEHTEAEEDEPIESAPHPSASASSIVDHALGRRARRKATPTRWILPLIVVGALAFLGYIAFLEFVPGAKIELTLATEPLEQTVVVTARPTQEEVDQDNAQILGRALSLEQTLERSAPATGKKQVGNKATGTITLYNYWDANPQNLGAGTVVAAPDGTQFVTTQAATIPGASTTLKEGKVVTNPGQVNTTIEAKNPGPEANGKSGQFTIPSLPSVRQDKIFGEVTTATAGGTSREVTIVTEADRQTLHNTALDAFVSDARAKASEDLKEGERLLDGALKAEIATEEYSAEVGGEAEELRVILTGTVRAMAIRDEHLKDATIAVLKKAIPSARMLVLADKDELVTTAKNFDPAADMLEIQVVVKSQTAIALDTESLIDEITGLDLDKAQTILDGAPGVTTAQIQLRPRWLSRLPKHANQIELTTTYAQDQEIETAPSNESQG